MTLPVDLSGRTAIVTGAGKGLGRAYALHLAACGAAVLVNNRRHAGENDADTSAAQTVAAIQQQGGRAVANWSDVCEPDSGHAMVTQARAAFGGLDIVVANAGVSIAGSFLKLGMAEFRLVVEDNGSQPQMAVRAIDKLLLKDEVFAVVNPFGSGTNATVVKRAVDAGAIYFAPWGA